MVKKTSKTTKLSKKTTGKSREVNLKNQQDAATKVALSEVLGKWPEKTDFSDTPYKAEEIKQSGYKPNKLISSCNLTYLVLLVSLATQAFGIVSSTPAIGFTGFILTVIAAALIGNALDKVNKQS